MITEVDVRKIFKGLEQGDGAGFFEHVDDKVDWIVEGLREAGRGSASRSSTRRRASAREGRSGGRRTSFLGDREEWSQIRQPLLLGLPLCE